MIYFPQPIQPPFRAEFVGTASMPESLAKARDGYSSGRISASELEAVETDALEQWVKGLYEIGYDEVCDGGLRGHIMTSDVIGDGTDDIAFSADGNLLKNFNALLSVTPFGAVARQDMPSPSTMYAETLLAAGNRAETTECLRRKVISATADAINALYQIGCRSILWIDHTWESGDSSMLAAINNEVLEALPADMNVALRPVYTDLTVKEVFDDVVARLSYERVKAFYINISVPGARELFPHLPADKFVVVSLTPSMPEGCANASQLTDLVQEIAGSVELERLSLGADNIETSETEDGCDQLGALRLVKDAADEIW